MITLDIIQECKNGKRLGQTKLFDAYASQMFNICFRYMKRDDVAEDMLSQGFARVFANIKRFEYKDELSLRSWIKKIVINECLMEYNLGKLDAEYIYQAILSLPTGYRTVLNLNIIEGFSHAEIAEMLKINEGTSRSQLNKARKLLKEKLSEETNRYERRRV
jgi:RNA polymerase sigma-70 factor (ECF subfamily)